MDASNSMALFGLASLISTLQLSFALFYKNAQYLAAGTLSRAKFCVLGRWPPQKKLN
jgi:hypothetical protein